MKKIFSLSALLASLLALASCATASAFVEGTKCTEEHEIKRSRWNWNGKTTLIFNDYELALKRQYAESSSKSSIFSIYYEKYENAISFTGELRKYGEKIYPVKIVSQTKGKTRDGFFVKTVKKQNTDTFVVIGESNPPVALNPLYDYKNDFLVDTKDSIDGFSIRIRPVNDTLQGGKRYTLWGGSLSGLDVFVNNEEYALVDFCVEPNKIFLNPDFPEALAQEHLDFTVGVILSAVVYFHALLYNNGSGEKEILGSFR